MKKVLAVFLKEYLERVKRRSFFIGLILTPLFMSGAFLVPLWLSTIEEETGSWILVIDQHGELKTPFEDAIQGELNSGEPRFTFIDRGVMSGGVNQARLADFGYLDSLLDDGMLDWYLVIPADVLEGAQAEFHGRVISNFMLLDHLRGELTALARRLRLESMNLDPDILERIDSEVGVRTVQHKGDEISETGGDMVYLSTLVMVMILYMTIIIFGTMIQRSVLEDKTQRVTELVLSSMSPTRFFAGKILGIGAVGLTQYFAWFLLALAAYLAMKLSGVILEPAAGSLNLSDLPALQPLTYVYFVVYYVLGFLLYAGLLAAVGAMSTTDQEAQQLMQPLVMLMVVPLVGMIYFMQYPDSSASVLLSLVPLFAPLVMFMRINVSSPPLWQIALSLGILLASVGVVFWISGRIFRVGILMTGKKASLVEAWRWVRQS